MSGGLLLTSESRVNDARLLLTTSASTLRRLSAEGAGEPFYCALAGASMRPTLRGEDLLAIVPYGASPVIAGDVVVCLPPDSGKAVVHRVTAVTSEGIRTRGDNNTCEDSWLLQRDDVVARVVAAWRGRRHRAVPGGWRGRLHACWVRLRTALERALSLLLHVPYNALAHSGIVRALVPERFNPRLVAFTGTEAQRLRLVLGRRVVGWYDGEADRWHIRRPYRLLVDEVSLPDASSPIAALDLSSEESSVAGSGWRTVSSGASRGR